MNFGAKVLEVLACRLRDWVRRCEGKELNEVDGEKDCCPSCLWTGVGLLLLLYTAERGREDGDMGDAIDMFESRDVLNGCW
jgi:hypothetical protein